MKIIYSLVTVLFVISFQISNAQVASGKIVDEKNEVVPYATIQVADFGTVSNSEGVFQLNVGDLPIDTPSKISFIGYKTIELSLGQLIDKDLFVLQKDVMTLDEVFVTNKRYTPVELIEKVLERVDSNYLKTGYKQRVYHRSQSTFYPIDFKQEIKKSTMLSKSQRKSINREIEDMIDNARGKSSTNFKEILSDYYRVDGTTGVAKVIKATQLKDEARDLSAKKTMQKMLNVIQTHLDTTHTYKISSGLFRLDSEAEVGDISLDDMGQEDSSTASSAISESLYDISLKNEALDFLHKTKRYDYVLQEATIYNDKTVYVLDFKPRKSRADFIGRLYINADDFAVVKMDFAIAPDRDGEKVNLKFLLGVKFVQEDAKYSITYLPEVDSGKYIPQILRVRSIEYMYFNRSFKFKRNKNNSDDEKKKLKFEFLIEGRADTNNEFYFTGFSNISKIDVEGIQMDATIEFEKIDRYNPEIWSDYQILPAIKELEEYQTN